MSEKSYIVLGKKDKDLKSFYMEKCISELQWIENKWRENIKNDMTKKKKGLLKRVPKSDIEIEKEVDEYINKCGGIHCTEQSITYGLLHSNLENFTKLLKQAIDHDLEIYISSSDIRRLKL